MNDRLAAMLWLAAAVAAVVASAIFSGVETGVYRLNRVRLRLRSESGDGPARTLVRLLRNQRSLLATLLIGTNIANYIGSSAIVALCSIAQFPEWQIAVFAPIIFAPVLLVFAEVVPKNIFQAYSDRYTYSFAGLLRWFRRVLMLAGLLPLVDALTGLLVRLTRRRLAAEADQLFHPRQQVGRLIAESSHQGALTPYQSFLVDRVMNLRSVRLAQVMVPLARVSAVPADIARDRFIAHARTHNHGRVLVYKDRPANAVGVVDVNAVLASPDPGAAVSGFIQDAPRLKGDDALVHALFALQRTAVGMGIVTDKGGAAVGIVTIKDLVEEIVGEIEEW
jgi:CBS domain containing-hemolysin-like protein